MSCRHAIFAVALLSMSPLLAPCHAGVVLFSDLDANDSSTASSTIIGGPGDFFDSRVAAAFTTPNDGTPDLLGTVEVVVGDFVDQPTTLDVRLYADNAGLPGAVLDSLSVTLNLGEPATATTALLTSSAHPSLQPGTTYWVGLTAGPNQRVFWLNNSPGQDLQAAVDWANTGTTWTTSDGIDPAFRVTSFVPEPATPLLACAATALLAARRRRGR